MQSLVAFPKLKRQVLVCDPEIKGAQDRAREFSDDTIFWVNQEFALM